MAKAAISITISDDVLKGLEKRAGNKSEIINKILRTALLTEEGIQNKIEYHQKQIEMLKAEKDELKENKKKRLEKLLPLIQDKLAEAKKILKKDPTKIGIWTEIINRDYDQCLTKNELKELVEKHG